MKDSGWKYLGKQEGNEIRTFSVPFSLGEFNESITITTNVPLTPKKEEIINQAFKFHSQGNFSEAAKYYQQVINQGFNDHRVFSNYGIILRSTGKLKEAEFYQRKAIELKPDFAEAHSNLGMLLKGLDKLKEAEICQRKAIELKPDFTNAHYNLGNILIDLGKLEEARICHIKAIKLKPDFTKAHKDLSICMYLMGDTSSALKSIKKANSLDTSEISIQLLLNIFQREENIKNSDRKINTDKRKKRLRSNPLILNIPVENKLIETLYKIKARDQEKYQEPTFGDAIGSDYNFFNRSEPIIKYIKEKLINVSIDSLKSDILIADSFFTIFRSGGGLISHAHLNKLDKIEGLNIATKKFSLVYYLSVGDQNCDEPGILKLEDPYQEILPKDGMVIIFPAERKHSVLYKGNKDRIIIGVNFYTIYS